MMKIAKYSYLISLLLVVGCDRSIDIQGTDIQGTDVQSTDSQVTNVSPNVIPAINKWTGGVGVFSLSEKTEVIAEDKLKDLVEIFAEDINAITGKTIKIGSIAGKGKIQLLLDINDIALGNEGYVIEINDTITIKANAKTGLFYGTQTLLQMLVQDVSNHGLPKGTIRDIPLVENRQFMLDVGRKFFSMDYLKRTIRNMAWYKLNTFHLHFTEWSGFRLQSDKFPGLASEQSYSKKDLREIQDYAARYNVMIIPEIDLPAHATHIIKYNPDFGFSCDSMLTAKWLPKEVNEQKVGWILNMTKVEVREFVHELLEEFIPLFDAPYFFIGGDEWQYDNQKSECKELVDFAKQSGYEHTGDVFVEWINEINEQVKSHGKTTQIWNWWRFSPDEKFKNETDTQPNKDIIVNVWNKQREAQIIADGYSVILTTEEGPGALYSTPGLGGTKPGDYAYFDSQFIYEQWQPNLAESVKGYKVCLWSDGAEHQTERWFDQHIETQKAVFSERVWSSHTNGTIRDFYDKQKSIGYAPINL